MTEATAPAPGPTRSAGFNRFGWVRKLLPRIVIGALIAAALVGVYAVVIGRWDETCWRLIGTIALLVFFSLVSWYDADVSARRAPWFGAVSVVLSAFLLLDGLWKIWAPALDGSVPDDWWWGFFSWMLLVAVTRLGLLHLHLVLNTQRRFTGPIMSQVTLVTLILVGALTVGLAAPLVFQHVDFGEAYWRLVGAIAILDALGTILIPLTYSLFGPKPAKAQGAPYTGPVAPVPAAVPPAAVPPAPAAFEQPVVAESAAPAYAAPTSAAPASAAPAAAYPNVLTPTAGLRLEWPRYINGTPLPAKPDGSPDFTGVIGY
ncbi:hypothetical protein KNO15_16990 [Leifsonia shinshuensis]|uniref:hypothetical protein n=1 Tax=Leifsonia shinshuensis TaxID=150026 RepID=UPI001F512E92|nr:hypothetical protein [Leifsonia shinshuensis]MCI0158400.1 hypothetical protein [Leifsonia shinshuensis]